MGDGDEVARELQLRHAQKMEAIGQLAGGIAHEFNNILQAATLELDLLQETPDLPAAAREHAVDIRATIDRAKALTHQLLVFSRRGAMKQQHVDLNARVVDVARMLRRVIGENISLQLELAPGALPAEVDPTMLDHVLVNLAVNARDAMHHAGTLAISTSSQHHDGPARAPGRYAVIAVRDTGPGIPPDILPRVFDPFFTTKESSGTGLGLATSHGIVEQHGGWIDVESSVGRGATFRVHLPIRDVPAIEAVAAPVMSRPRGSERILIVEDDLYVRRGLFALLESAGYQPVVAESGAAALSLWESPVGPFDLVLTDLIMPGGINGRDLANRLAERSQIVPVIFMTGHGQHLEIGAPHPILRKPVDPDALLVAIRAALDAAPRG